MACPAGDDVAPASSRRPIDAMLTLIGTAAGLVLPPQKLHFAQELARELRAGHGRASLAFWQRHLINLLQPHSTLQLFVRRCIARAARLGPLAGVRA